MHILKAIATYLLVAAAILFISSIDSIIEIILF